LDDNQVLEYFDEIENKIQKLIDVRKTLEVDLQDQKDYIAQLEIELQEKIEAESKLIEERSFVRSKIDSLLTKLQDIQIPINSDSQKS
jgi:FtsZ-binding cell division protein ZapB